MIPRLAVCSVGNGLNLYSAILEHFDSSTAQLADLLRFTCGVPPFYLDLEAKA